MYNELLNLLWPKYWCFVCLRIYELQQALSEANRRRDEGMHTMDIILREKDHANQADKLNLTSKVADTVEDVNKRLLSKEIKMREEMQERYLQLERVSFKSSFFFPYKSLKLNGRFSTFLVIQIRTSSEFLYVSRGIDACNQASSI